MAIPDAYIDGLKLSGTVVGPGGHEITTMMYVTFVIEARAEKRLLEALRDHQSQLHGAAALRAFCLALCPELALPAQQVSQKALAALGGPTTMPPDAYHKHTGRRSTANLQGKCYNCGRYSHLCFCPKGLVPQ